MRDMQKEPFGSRPHEKLILVAVFILFVLSLGKVMDGFKPAASPPEAPKARGNQ